MKILNSDHPFIAVVYWILRIIIGIPVRMFLIKKVTGLRNIPKDEAAILAFNHQSFFDFICFAAISPKNVHFLSAEKFFEHRWWRKLMIATGQIRVNRISDDKSIVFQSVQKHIDKRMLIGVFPEGTRSPYRDQMLKAFTGIAQFALKHHVPIIPIGIKGTFDIMSKNDRMPKLIKTAEIHIGDPLRFHQHHDRHTDHQICTYVTERVIREIETLSGKVYSHYESTI